LIKRRGHHHPQEPIFAADGPKPDLVLSDAVRNTTKITSAEFCLVYDRPLQAGGLSSADLVSWWAGTHASACASERDVANDLHALLARSLDRGRDPSAGRGPELVMFQTYTELLKHHGFALPALIPQVYLHYDPYSRTSRRVPGPLQDLLLTPPRNPAQFPAAEHRSSHDPTAAGDFGLAEEAIKQDALVNALGWGRSLSWRDASRWLDGGIDDAGRR
jgi:hypothetical protein